INPASKCSAFCLQSTGWFWGQPINLMNGAWCDVGDGCSHSITFSNTLGNTQTTGHTKSSSSSTSSTNSLSRGYTLTHSAGATLSMGVAASVGFKIPLIASSSLNFGVSANAGTSWSMTEGASETLAKSASESESYSRGNSTSYNVAVTMTDGSGPKPAWADRHCGSWYAVPVIAMGCGKATVGKLMRNEAKHTERCGLEHKTASVDHCFEWTIKDTGRPDNTRSKIIFAVKDCAGGFLLPGEFQHPIFGNSFSPSTLIEDHIQRFGFLGRPPSYLGPKPIDDAWTIKDHNFVMNAKDKTIGPADGNLEICGRGGYCARHKLTDRNCYTFKRGYEGAKSAHIVSAKVSPGNCCVLFSRHECHGLPQVIKGEVRDFSAVGFEGLAHSVICNVNEYCNPVILDIVKAPVA
ncbi:hypothetical protein QBC39DRAFT_254622, partial [Podospora conica]